VIGVDDIPAAKLAVPPLTTVTTDQAAIARHLAQTVVSIITGEPEPPPAGIRRGPGDPARLRVGRGAAGHVNDLLCLTPGPCYGFVSLLDGGSASTV